MFSLTFDILKTNLVEIYYKKVLSLKTISYPPKPKHPYFD